MKIRSIQITRKTEEIIKEYLYSGVYPSFETITRKLSLWLREQNLGAPSFKHRRVNKREITNVEKFNASFKELEQDLRDIYEATIFQFNTTMKNYSKLEIERAQMVHELENLKDEIEEALTTTRETDVKYIKESIINFTDARDVNLDSTSAHLDSDREIVTLKEKDGTSERVILTGDGSRVEVYGAFLQSETVEPITNAFDDKINTRWWHRIRTKELNIGNKMEIGLVIPLNGIKAINSIQFVPHHSKEVYISLEYSTDGEAFSPLRSLTHQKVTKSLDFSFPTIRASHIKLRFVKNEYDDRFGDTYNYSFGAKMIKIFKKEYEEKSIFETKLFQLPLNARRLSFMFEDEIPASCDIEYEVSLNPDFEQSESDIWHKVSSIDDRDNSKAKELLLDPNRRDTITFNRCVYDERNVNGMRAYKLYTPSGSNVIETYNHQGELIVEEIENPKLYRGINQIKRESLYYSFDGSVPLLSDWDTIEREKQHLVKTAYFSKQNEFSLRDDQDNMYRFSFSVYSESSRTIPLSVNTTYKIVNRSALKSGVFSIYANKERLIPSNDEVTIKMEKGWTEIQILYHAGNVLERSDFSKSEARPRTINIGKFSLGEEMMIRGDLEPLRLTDKDNLFHNISPHSKDYYAIEDREIFLNHDSKDTIFQLIFNQKRRADVTSNIKIRATLKRGTLKEVTPKIKKIRVRTM